MEIWEKSFKRFKFLFILFLMLVVKLENFKSDCYSILCF